ncbi:MAG: lysylphosphatidylglycerol synthase transmembrane domain-containing protein [Nitrospirota bacterium]
MALKANRIFLFILKLTVSFALLYIVLSRTGTERILSILKGLNLLAFISAVFLYLFAQFISTIRWKLLLKGERVSIKRLFSLYMIGSFFNIFLPGIIGGDAVKGIYLYQATGKGGLTLASIFMDRYLGFVVLMVISIIAFPFGYKYLQGTDAVWLLPLVVVCFIGVSLLIFGLRLGRRIKILSDFYGYFHTYRNQKKILINTLALSVIVQVSGIAAVYILAIGIGQHIPLFTFMLFLPLIILFSTLPISVSGIGVREGAFIIFFGLVGVDPDVATAISLAWFISITAGSLWGLFEYIRYKKYQIVEDRLDT